MRLHKFPKSRHTDEVWINLDAISGVLPARMGGVGCILHIGDCQWEVKEPLDDVLALISPPAAPDRYEEELRNRSAIDPELTRRIANLADAERAKIRAAGPGMRIYSDRENEIRGRLDELDQVMAAYNSPQGWLGIANYVSNRRAMLNKLED